MTLLISYNDFVSYQNGQVYPLELPNYFEITGTMTVESYYQKVMLNCQIIIDNYCQSILTKADWDLTSFSNLTREAIINILVAEFVYVHENQLFFKKTNEIQYSTAGQQTFTFSPENNSAVDYFIPANVKRMIENAGIKSFSASILNSSFNPAQESNEFLDGVFVDEVRWDSKANASFALEGVDRDLIAYIIFLSTDYISKTNQEWLSLKSLNNLFIYQNNKIMSNYILTAPNVYSNKSVSDYAQVDDIIKTYNVIDSNVQNNTNNIATLTSVCENLETNKVSRSQFSQDLSLKTNIDLQNVAVGAYPVPRSVIVDTNGNIQFSTSGGAIFDITQWSDTVTYVQGRLTFVYGATPSYIYAATNKPNNKNKNPLTEPTFWQRTNLNIDLSNYYTKNETNLNFLNKTGQTANMNVNLNMGGYAITNVSNLLDDSKINDTIISDSNLWTSKKTNDEIQKIPAGIKEYMVFDAWEFKQTLAKDSTFAWDNHFVNINSMLQWQNNWGEMYRALNMTQDEIVYFESKNRNPVKDTSGIVIGGNNNPKQWVNDYFPNSNQTDGYNGNVLAVTNNFGNFTNTNFTGSYYLPQNWLPNARLWLNNNYSTTDTGALLFHKSGGGNTNGYFPIVSGFWDQAPTRTRAQYYVDLNTTTQQRINTMKMMCGMLLCYRPVKVKVGV